MMKFSRAISPVKWLSGKKTNVSKTRTEMVFETLVFFTAQPFDPADSPKKLHHTIIFPSAPRSSKWYLPLRFSEQHFVRISHLMHAT
jgi:hypothetical protein